MKLLEVNWKEKGFHSLPEPSPTVSCSSVPSIYPEV